jgi:hypothetical protein
MPIAAAIGDSAMDYLVGTHDCRGREPADSRFPQHLPKVRGAGWPSQARMESVRYLSSTHHRWENHGWVRCCGDHRDHDPGRLRAREHVALARRPLIRVSASGQPDPVTAAIARHVTDSGSVFLELPDGRLTVVVHLAGCSRIPERSVLRTSRASLQHLSEM